MVSSERPALRPWMSIRSSRPTRPTGGGPAARTSRTTCRPPETPGSSAYSPNWCASIWSTDGRTAPRPLGDYLAAFPALLSEAEPLAAAAFEEFRLRLEHGEKPQADEYRGRYGVDTSAWVPHEDDGADIGATQVVEHAPRRRSTRRRRRAASSTRRPSASRTGRRRRSGRSASPTPAVPSAIPPHFR